MTTELILILLLWLIVFMQSVAYYLYGWQIKEYRVDRFVAHVREPDGYALIIPRSFYVKVLLLVILLFFARTFPYLFLFWLTFYSVGALVAMYRIVTSQFIIPVITLKTSGIFLLSVVTPLSLFPLFSSLGYGGLMVYLLEADILAFLFVSFWVIVFKPFTYIAKQMMVARAKKKRAAMKRLCAIGVTGSYGKTTTKEILAHILAAKFRVAKTREHQNTEVGASRAMLAMSRRTEVLVAEMAAYRRGDIREIAEAVKPTMGIITAIGPQHVTLFGSIETILETKFELAQALPQGSTLIVNHDNEMIRTKLQAASYNLEIISYSLRDPRADVYASRIKVYPERLEFNVHHKTKKERFGANLLGKHMVSNILAATSAALCLGMTLRQIAREVESFGPLHRTMQLRRGMGGVIFIDDSYNASVDGVKAGLAYMAIYKKKRRIIVMPSLIELGDKAYVLHEELGQEIAKTCDYAFITDTRFQEAILRGWQSIRGNAKHIHFHKSPKRLAREVEDVITKESVVLFEGRIPFDVIDFLYHPWKT